MDRLLFGSAIGLGGADVVAGRGRRRAGAWRRALLLGRAWTAVGVRPRGRPRAWACPAARADLALLLVVGATAVAALPAVGALLVTSLFVVPAAIARLLAALGRPAGGRARSAWPRRRALLGLYGALWLDVPPGPAVAVLGAAAYALVAAVARPGGPSRLAARGAGVSARARRPRGAVRWATAASPC